MATPRSLIPIIILFACLIKLSLNQTAPSDSCFTQNTCHECIQAKGCSWCAKPSLDPTVSDGNRCFSSSGHPLECEAKFLVNPKNEQNVLEEKPLTKIGGPRLRTGLTRDGQEIVQISPQKIGLKLRLSEIL